jgi:hypothetical protein
MQENFKFLKNKDYSILFARNIIWSKVEDIPQKNLNSKLEQLLLSEETKSLELLIVDNPTSQENTINELYTILKQIEMDKLLVISSMHNISIDNSLNIKQKNNYSNDYKNCSYFIEQNTIQSLIYFEDVLRTLKMIYDIRTIVITDFNSILQLTNQPSITLNSILDFCDLLSIKIIGILNEKDNSEFIAMINRHNSEDKNLF